MANLLIERTQNSSWVVVFKALVTIHNLMNHGNERFSQFLASSNCTFHLDSFYDRGGGLQGYAMSAYIHKYAKYLNKKAYSYRQMAFDFCRVKRGKDDGILRSMNTEELIKALPLLQAQFDALVEFEVTASQITNGIISGAFMLLFKDLIRLYACYNDGIINMLGRYFDMNKKNCREAFEIYKQFVTRVDKVDQFFKIAESIGVDRGDIPDLAKAPASLLDALEQHLTALENTKKVSTVSNVGGGLSVSNSGHVSAEVTRPSSAAVSVNAASVSEPVRMSLPPSGPATITDADRRRILEEEERMLDMIKQQNLKHSAAAGLKPAAAPAASAAAAYSAPPPGHPSNFGAPQMLATVARPDFNPFGQLDPGFELPPVPPSYDLLGLQQPSQSTSSSNGMSFTGDSGMFLRPTGVLDPSPVMNAPAKTNVADLFGFDQMGATGPSPAPLIQAQAAPTNFTGPAGVPASVFHPGSTSMGATSKPVAGDKSQKLITSDLDASLATIAGNLSIQPTDHYRRMDHNWTGPTDKKLTGTTSVAGNPWAQGPSVYPVGMQPPMVSPASQYPAMMPAYPASMGQSVMMIGSQGGMLPPSQSHTMSSSQPASSAPLATTSLPPNDPFGLL